MISNNEFDDWGQQQPPNGAPAQNTNAENPSVDLMQVAMRRKGLIALGVFLGLCLGLLYYARATPKYESTAQLSVEELAAPAQNRNDLSFGLDFAKGDDHAFRIASPRIVGDTLDNNEDLKSLPSLVGQENPVKTILDGLSVEPVQDGSDILRLTFSSTNPEDCSQIWMR